MFTIAKPRNEYNKLKGNAGRTRKKAKNPIVEMQIEFAEVMRVLWII